MRAGTYVFFDTVMHGLGNQEHGILSILPGGDAPLPDLPVGTRLRILPHHACATAAQHRAYEVVDGSQAIEATWPRSGGW